MLSRRRIRRRGPGGRRRHGKAGDDGPSVAASGGRSRALRAPGAAPRVPGGGRPWAPPRGPGAPRAPERRCRTCAVDGAGSSRPFPPRAGGLGPGRPRAPSGGRGGAQRPTGAALGARGRQRTGVQARNLPAAALAQEGGRAPAPGAGGQGCVVPGFVDGRLPRRPRGAWPLVAWAPRPRAGASATRNGIGRLTDGSRAARGPPSGGPRPHAPAGPDLRRGEARAAPPPTPASGGGRRAAGDEGAARRPPPRPKRRAGGRSARSRSDAPGTRPSGRRGRWSNPTLHISFAGWHPGATRPRSPPPPTAPPPGGGRGGRGRPGPPTPAPRARAAGASGARTAPKPAGDATAGEGRPRTEAPLAPGAAPRRGTFNAREETGDRPGPGGPPSPVPGDGGRGPPGRGWPRPGSFTGPRAVASVPPGRRG